MMKPDEKQIVSPVVTQSGAWKKVKLGDVADSALGKMLDKVKNQGEYHPYLANVDVRWGEFDLSNLSQMRFQESEIEKYAVKYNDLIICEGGETGRCALWKHHTPMLYQKALHRVRSKNKDVLNIEYLYYWFLLAGKKNLIDQYTTGATIKHLPAIKLNGILIDLPPIEIQDSIATTLSRYDNLIANYHRQIKLLEEAAQRLYKEWFVDLHYPGHENVKVIDGVPEGWEKKRLGEVADINKETIRKDFNGEINYIDLSSTKNGRIISRQKYEFSNAPGRARRIAHDGDIVWGMVRPNLKSYALVMSPSERDVFSTGFAVIAATDVPFTFLYFYATTESFIKYLINCTNGAAYPAVKPIHFAEAECKVPTKELLKQFDCIVEPIVRKISLLDTQLTLLTESRDRLLPKLMSGEIELKI